MRYAKFLGLCAVMLAVFSCAHPPSTEGIVGRWENKDINRVIVFKEDGTIEQISSLEPSEFFAGLPSGEWVLDGTRLEINFEDLEEPVVWRVSISGDSLLITKGEGAGRETFLYKRIDE